MAFKRLRSNAPPAIPLDASAYETIVAVVPERDGAGHSETLALFCVTSGGRIYRTEIVTNEDGKHTTDTCRVG
jgi:hypothetical protein